ncbi:AMIN domain-containing protein [Chelativorans sp. ZYF759]|uniref:N-acetylmuramoyl-L-alanine amidase n=1 Tax=Chelativorans sp. ZYF759 TaxID=2692213 RepID=UPI00145E2F47|nr:N-acetylmuramoyl-L-alanine amidase [Chelativorans sp. ZYF759]NMG39959.1 AMIN domain-containing protein [Chelativorans sp. ZYF759]
MSMTGHRSSTPTVSGAPRDVLRRLVLVVAAMLTLAAVPAASAEGGSQLVAQELRIAGDATRARLLLRFDSEPTPRWFLLRNPHRLVIDLPETEFDIESDQVQPRGLVSRFQHGRLGPGTSRIIISSEGPFTVDHIEVMENSDSPGHRLVVDLLASSDREFEEALAEQIATTGSTQSTPKTDRLGGGAVDREGRPFVIVLDPGHGGIDSGAAGTKGTQEKMITLAFALELRAALQQLDGYQIFLTRDRDLFLTLDERVRIARQHEADLFISIHADSYRQSGVRGATVYTISDRPSDAESAATAIRENLSDAIAGIEVAESKDDVADILVDLVRRETQRFSMRFARTLVGKLSQQIDLINNPHRFAGFKVLRAPDVPSVLLELGYLSNPQDEEQLRDAEWRAGAIDSVLTAIKAFSQGRNGSDG